MLSLELAKLLTEERAMGYEGSSLLVSMNWLYLFTALSPC
jgi:hypothetical protein